MTTQQYMAGDGAITVSRFPIRLLTIALFLTTMTLAWLGKIILDERHEAKTFQAESLRIEELRGVIVHLDEVLTMSARMAAATGDPKWEERYRRFDPQLDAAIKETVRLGTSPSSVKTAAKTDEANITLVAMENRAFALVRAGRKEEAWAVLFSPEYEAQKQIYADGIKSFNDQIRREADERESQNKRIDFLSMIGALIVLAISFAAWLSVLRSLRRWRANLEQAVSRRQQAEQALRQANETLEARIQQRTAELEKTNQTLQVEITERKQAEMEIQHQATFARFNPNPVLELSASGEINYFNHAAGAKAHEMGRETPAQMLPPNTAAMVRECLASGTPKVRVETQIGARVISWSFFPVKFNNTVHCYAGDITERRQSEEALRRSETKFRTLYDSTGDAVMLLDEKGFFDCNPAALAMLGCASREEFCSKHPVDVSPPTQPDGTDSLTLAKRQIATAMEKGSHQFEWMHKRADTGKVFPADVLLSTMELDGKPVLQAVVRDTSERKRAEETLRASQQIIEGIINAIPARVFWKDKNLVYLGCNAVFARDAGFADPKDLIGKDDFQMGWRAQAEKYRGDDRQVIQDGCSKLLIEEPQTTPEGNTITLLSSKIPLRNSTGEINGVIGTYMDITERKRMENALRASEEKFRSLFESSRDAIMTTEPPSWIFTSGNPAAVKMLGAKSEEEFILYGISDLSPDLQPDGRTSAGKAKEIIETILREGSHLFEWTFRRLGGEEFRAEVLVTRMEQGGKVILQATVRDITARRRFEARLFESQKMETVGKLAGGVAHEFNSIMTAIIGQSELMLYDLPAGNPLRKNASEIHQAADRAAALTRQLLAYGRKQILQPDILDLNHVLAGMENTLRHLAGHDVDVRIAPPAGPMLVKADAGQIEQVIVNIVMNAADAMPNGGKLTLETAGVFLDQQYVSQFPDLKPGDYVRLAITDTGAGMSEAVKARLFEPFFTTKEVGQGTGLGLATCHGIIKQSDGHINVYSEPGRGATFKIYLPKARLENKPPGPPLQSPGLPRGTETILLVEDDPALREMAAALLGRLGYTVLTAGNGLEALNVTHQRATGHIDLLFTDVVMPHMSGKELSDRIQALYPRTKILFTSAYTETAIVHQGVLNPGVVLLQKPFTPSALAGKVREVLDNDKEPPPPAAVGP